MKDFGLNFTMRSDLADESEELFGEKSTKCNGLESHTQTYCGFTVHTLEVTSPQAQQLCGKPCGKYITVEIGKIWNADKNRFKTACKILADCISSFLPDNDGACLLAALGNKDIIADAVGPYTAGNFIVTRHISELDPELYNRLSMRKTSCICTGVLSGTGVEAAEIVKGAVLSARPDFIIAVDALASRRLSRLATTVQICNTGISPGSGINNHRKEISSRTCGVPVIAIGVPTVVEATTLAKDIIEESFTGSEKNVSQLVQHIDKTKNEGFFVTPKDTDHIIKDVSKLIGYSINLALHKDISIDEIDEFVS